MHEWKRDVVGYLKAACMHLLIYMLTAETTALCGVYIIQIMNVCECEGKNIFIK